MYYPVLLYCQYHSAILHYSYYKVTRFKKKIETGEILSNTVLINTISKYLIFLSYNF